MAKLALIAHVVFALSLSCDHKESKADSTDPIDVSKSMQPTVDKWSANDPAVLPPAPPSLAHGRKVLVVFLADRSSPVAYAPSSAGSCFATKPEEVGVVVFASGQQDPARPSATGGQLHDKTWQFAAVAIPENRRVASWRRVALANDTTRKTVGGVSQTVPLSSSGVSFAGFPADTFNADCVALQAGTQPASD